ncbi:MAG: hypothetical protein MK052_07595 [Alphaproteobacteria bacterium]|nr:hypothetical protein [Alphaproteobacteria bacterium]
MNTTRKLTVLLALGAAAIPATVYAASTNIDATAEFRGAITLGNEVDMDFGTIEYSAAPAAGDTIALGTNGAITSGGNFSGPATGTAGSVDVTAGSDGVVVEIFCDATATMAETGGGTIDVTSIEVATEGNEAAAGSANACQGMSTAATTMTLDISGGSADRIVLGGTIDGSTASSFVAGSYSTATAGGDNIQIDVTYQ